MSLAAILKSPYTMAILSQALFTAGDLIARSNMRSGGFTMANFCTLWFAAYFALRQFAMFGQLYIFSTVQLGKTMAIFGAISIVLSNALGLLLLSETLTPMAYLGAALAALAFAILAFS